MVTFVSTSAILGVIEENELFNIFTKSNRVVPYKHFLKVLGLSNTYSLCNSVMLITTIFKSILFSIWFETTL